MNLRALQFSHAFARGLIQTPFEVIVLVVCVALVVLVVTAYLVLAHLAARRRLARHSRRIMDQRTAELGLRPQEIELVHRLAGHCDLADSEHVLLVNRRIFDACARHLLQAEEDQDTRINALRLKLGFRITRPEETPGSSAELPEGSAVVLQPRAGPRSRGTLVGQGPSGMIVKVGPSVRWFPRGSPVTMYFFNPAGVFSFSSRVMDRGVDVLHLEHASKIARHQRRRYYRKKEPLSVLLRPLAPGAAPRRALLVDLGGGGACVDAAGWTLREGDRVELSLPASILQEPVEALVARVSRDGRVCGLKFESISESERNRIMGFVFARSEPPELPAARGEDAAV